MVGGGIASPHLNGLEANSCLGHERVEEWAQDSLSPSHAHDAGTCQSIELETDSRSNHLLERVSELTLFNIAFTAHGSQLNGLEVAGSVCTVREG